MFLKNKLLTFGSITTSLIKKYLGILLLFFLVSPYFFSYIFLKNEIRLVKKKAKHKIEEAIAFEDLTKLTFSINEVKELLVFKGEKEFEYKGNMYDIIYSNKSDNNITYWCVNDNEETALNNKVNDLLTLMLQKNAKKSTHQRIVAKYFPNYYQNKTERLLSVYHLSQIHQNSIYRFSCKTFQTAPDSPPPKHI